MIHLPAGDFANLNWISLFLDVWTPSDSTKDSKLPVRVWIYGGSNENGGVSNTLYDGCNSADQGAVLVSINYRLGPLGFMALEKAGIYGNQGIQDLLLGLEWIQDNIAQFGGDPVFNPHHFPISMECEADHDFPNRTR